MTGDYKPCLALLPGGELLLVMFASVDPGLEIREDMILYRSSDGAKTWGERTVLPLLGREPYFSLLGDGTLFITTHLRKDEIRNPDRYTHSYVHRSTDKGKTWSTLRIGAEDVPGVPPKTWTHTSRNILELRDGSLILGVSAGSSTDYLWRSKDKGQTWDKSLACKVEGFEFVPCCLPNVLVFAAQPIQELPTLLRIKFDWLQIGPQERQGGIGISVKLENGTRRARIVAVQIRPPVLQFLLRYITRLRFVARLRLCCHQHRG